MYFELSEDVAEGGRSLAKARAAAEAQGITKGDPKYPRLKVTVSKRGRLEFRKGLVVTMTDEGAKKWADRGLGKVVEKPVSAPEKQVITAADVGKLKV